MWHIPHLRNAPLRAKNCTADCPNFYDYLENAPQLVITDNGNGNFSTFAEGGIGYTWSVDNGLFILSGQGTPNVVISSASVPATVSVIVKTRCWTKTLNGFVPSCVGTVGTLSSTPTSIITTPSGSVINEYSTCLLNGTTTNVGVTYTNCTISNNAIIYINNSPYTVPSPVAGESIITILGQPSAIIYPTGRVKFTRYGTYTTFAIGCGPSLQYIIRILQQSPGCRLVAEIPKNSDTVPSSAIKINFVVFPNPSSGNEITISKDVSKTSETSASTGEEQTQSEAPAEAKNEEYTLVLYNKLQVKVRETTLNTPSKTISTEGLPNDVYFLHIISKDGSKVVKQVMILR